MAFVVRTLGAGLAALTLSSACLPSKTTLESVATAGTAEVWVVVEESKGGKSFGYVVHHCTPSGCKAVGTVQGVQKDEQR